MTPLIDLDALADAIAERINTTPKRLAHTYQQTADLLGVSYTSVRKLVRDGKLATLDGLERIADAELQRYVNGGEVAA